MEQEIHELVDEGEEEEHQCFDPFPHVEFDHGVGSQQVYEHRVY